MAISKSFAARYASQTPTDNFSPIATTPTHSIANDVHSGQPHNYASNQVNVLSHESVGPDSAICLLADCSQQVGNAESIQLHYLNGVVFQFSKMF